MNHRDAWMDRFFFGCRNVKLGWLSRSHQVVLYVSLRVFQQQEEQQAGKFDQITLQGELERSAPAYTRLATTAGEADDDDDDDDVDQDDGLRIPTAADQQEDVDGDNDHDHHDFGIQQDSGGDLELSVLKSPLT